MRYVAIRSEGGLIPYDLLDKIATDDAAGQKPGDFGLPKGRRLTDEISRVWSDAQSLWDIFSRRRESLSEKDQYGTTLTRERWILPLLSDSEMLGFDLHPQPTAAIVNNSSYAISHRAGDGDDAIPVHIEGFKIDLDRRLHTKLRTSPQAMLQDFLNNSEHVLWGIKGNIIHRNTVCDVTIGGRHKRLAIRGCSIKEAKILLDSSTRSDLSLEVGQSYDVELRPVSWIGYWRWAWKASDPAYRVPSQISMISFALGLIGLLLGVLGSLTFWLTAWKTIHSWLISK